MNYFFSTLLLLTGIIYSVQAQTWEQISNPPFQTHHSNGFGYQDKAYVLRGSPTLNFSAQPSDEFWEYDSVSDKWTQLEDFPGVSRAIAIGVEYDGKYYYGFGRNSSGRLNDLWVFDPVDTSFTQLASCPCIGRAHPALIGNKGKIFMGSGSSANGDLNDWWEYDIETNTWTQKANIPGPVRHHPFQFADEDYVYVGGGHIDTWWRFNVEFGFWSDIDNQPLGRVAGSQFSYKNRGFLLAGDDRDHNHIPVNETFMMYTPEDDQWEELPSLPNGSRWANSSFIINDFLYYFGGIDYDNESDNSMWKFDLTSLNLDPPVSTESALDETVIQALPNPVYENLSLQGLTQGKRYTVRIVNAIGTTVYYNEQFSSDLSIDMSSMTAGTYFLSLQNDSDMTTKQLIKL